jgi:hypothetical protein
VATLEENLRLAKRAIQFVDAQQIRSVNMKHQFWNRTDFDSFLFGAMRCHPPDLDNVRKGHRRDLLTALRAPGQSLSRRKKRCKEYFKAWGSDKNYFWNGGVRVYWDVDPPGPDAQRIRAARRAMKFYKGNCNEKSAVAATWLLENRLGNDMIVWASGGPYDHAYVIYDFRGANWDPSITNWNDEAVIVDGWTSDWYAVKQPYDLRPWSDAHFPGPIQLHVRRMIQANTGNLGIKEWVWYRPPQFSPNFTLAVARDPNSSYEAPPQPQPQPQPQEDEAIEVRDEDIISIADDRDALADTLEDGGPEDDEPTLVPRGRSSSSPF